MTLVGKSFAWLPALAIEKARPWHDGHPKDVRILRFAVDVLLFLMLVLTGSLMLGSR